jgi:CubicO group peptidase (beta-lactamase class C family)
VTRRAFLGQSLAAAGTLLFAPAALRGQQDTLAGFDALMTEFLKDNRAPGAALAIAEGERLVYARGFGLASREEQRPVEATDLFRIASISKPLTAVAVLQLAERGKLDLLAKVWEVLALPEPYDARWKRVTLVQLLQHTGGWDRSRSFDPMFRSAEIVGSLGVSPPAGPAEVIRYMLQRPLEFDPGTRYAYSNFGYCLLGRAIERVAGANYEKYVQQEVLAPLGIRRMRIGATLPAQRAAGEVSYYDERMGPAVVGEVGARVPHPYGAWYLEAMDSHGGWIGSAVDLVRFGAAFNDPGKCKILGAKSIALMFARPELDSSSSEVWYGCGWDVRALKRPGAVNTWHTGSLPGTSTLLVRRFDGKTWAVLFNMRDAPDGRRLSGKIDPLLHKVANEVRDWPAEDNFARML